MRWNKIMMCRCSAAVLAGSMMLCVNAAALSAAQMPSDKEEVVYAMLDASGNVSGVYVVNSFAGGDIVDYGDYCAIRNLTTTDEIAVNGDTVTLHTDADKVYYQGDLETKDIPWNIGIRYYMDGREYAPGEIAGMSGALEIQICVTRNQACDAAFFDGYALQAAVTLDTKQCKNIVAEGATIANVAADKQLSYIILPGKGAELVITADVTDFRMDAILINGMKLNLDLELESDELTEQVREIQDAVAGLNDGAGALYEGADELEGGAKGVYDGSVSLSEGASSLNDGIAALNAGISTMQSALQTLNGKSGDLTGGSAEVLAALTTMQTSLSQIRITAADLTALSQASTQTKKGIDGMAAILAVMDGNIDSYQQSVNQALATQGMDMNSYLTAHDTAVQTLQAAIGSGMLTQEEAAMYTQLAWLLATDKELIAGSDQIIGGIDAQLNPGTENTLMQVASALQSGYAQLDAQMQSMTVSLGTLPEQMAALKDGIDTLTESYRELHQGILGYTGAVAELSAGFEQIYQGSMQASGGATQLYSGTKTMVDGALELYNGSTELRDGTAELKDGTDEFYDKTADMNTQMEDTVNEKVEEMTGKNVAIASFVSEKNSNVDSVLFVLKTPAIEKAEVETVTEETVQTESFWGKFLALFQ